jgi:LmbE family N-acetylglucosaminyl deacetylase
VLAGAEILVVIMTDGRTSHAQLIDVDQLVRMRRAEACAAAHELGLDPATYRFLDFPDGELHRHRGAAVAATRELIASFAPDEVFLPHRDDRQPDHVETYRIVRAALAGYDRAVRVFEYPVWLWHCWPWTWGAGRTSGLGYMTHLLASLRGIWEIAFRCNERSDIAVVRERKLRALQAYHSQMQRRDGDPRWPIMADVAGGEFVRHFQGSEEMFRRSLHEGSSRGA